ncbi:MAG: proline--tRNA ligase, partial [Actinomycetales bacterium]|nr:proline--tRNA ligase [Actinomycetales bacterium]
GLFARAKAFRKEHTHVIDTEEAFYEFFKTPETADNETAPIHAGFVMAHFNGDPKLEERIKNDLAVTVRCIPLDGQKLCDDQGRPGTCPFTGEPSAKRVVWAKSY